jgi:hypothetical protein
MNCIIDGIDFYNLEAMRYYSPSTSWSQEKKKENAISKIFSGEWWGARKVDGIFCMCGKNPEGEIFLRPRAKNTKGEFVNKVDWVPQFHWFLNELEPGTVLLGEVYLPRDEQAKTTTSIMNCLLKKSLARQSKEEDKLHLYVFDILADSGESYLNMKAIDRFLRVEDYSTIYNNPYIEWAKYYNGKELWDMLQHLLANGYEGMVITYEDAPYQPGKRSNKVSLKVKRELQDTIDCVIIGANTPTKLSGTKEPESWEWWFNETTNEKILASEYFAINHESIYKFYVNGGPVVPVTKGWFYGWAGSLKLGLYNGDKLIHVGDLSGIDESIKANWRDYVNTVVEISCMEIHDTGGLRHPRALNFMRDKNPKDCIVEQIR